MKIEKNYCNNEKNYCKVKLKVSNEQWQEYDLMPFIQSLKNQFKEKNGEVTTDEIAHEFDLGNYHFKIYFDSIDISKDKFLTLHENSILIKKK